MGTAQQRERLIKLNDLVEATSTPSATSSCRRLLLLVAVVRGELALSEACLRTLQARLKRG